MTDEYLDTDWILQDFDPPKKAVPEAALPKGQCPKCGKHIGRGSHFHIAKCEGVKHGN